MEAEWTPQMMKVLGIERNSLPIIWDADFLYGAKDAALRNQREQCLRDPRSGTGRNRSPHSRALEKRLEPRSHAYTVAPAIGAIIPTRVLQVSAGVKPGRLRARSALHGCRTRRQ